MQGRWQKGESLNLSPDTGNISKSKDQRTRLVLEDHMGHQEIQKGPV